MMSPLTHVVCSPRPPWPGCGVISIMKLALQDQSLVGALDDGRAQLSAGWFTQADLSATGTPQAVLPASSAPKYLSYGRLDSLYGLPDRLLELTPTPCQMFGVLLTKTLKNYVCVSIQKGGDIVVRVAINPDTIERKPGSAPDVRGRGAAAPEISRS